MKSLALSLALLLGTVPVCNTALAGVCDVEAPAECVNTYHIFGQDGEIKLVSNLRYSGPRVQLRYIAELKAVDALLRVRWSEPNGATLLNAENSVNWFNSYVSWSAEWVGLLLPKPSVTLLTGTADFTGSVPRPNDCAGGVCDARYYDWTANVRSPGPASRVFSLHDPAPPAALPPGFEGATGTIGALQSVVPSATDPTNFEAATYADQYRFSSNIQAAPGGWRYTYSFENLTDGAVDFALPELGFAGTAAAHASATQEWVSALGPGLLRTAPTITRDVGQTASGRFDALVPTQAVPEPGSVALLLAGLCLVVFRCGRPAGQTFA